MCVAIVVVVIDVVAAVAVAAQIKNVQMSVAITQMSMHLFNLKCACGSTFGSATCPIVLLLLLAL